MKRRRSRILVIGPVGYPGGLQTHFSELCGFLLRTGYEVSAVGVLLPGASESTGVKIAIPSDVVAKRTMGWLRAWWLVWIERPTLVITVATGYAYALLAATLPPGTKSLRTVVTNDWPKNSPVHVAMALSHDFAAVQSQGLLSAQHEKIPISQKLEVLPCFSHLDVSSFTALTPEPGEVLRLCYFGRLAENKGLLLLLQILDASRRAGNLLPVKLHIWGRGEIHSVLAEAITNTGLTDIVELKGAYPEGVELSKLMSSYHGLVLPSQYCEGLPLVLLEAASVGLPFLSCDVGAIRDCLDNNRDCEVIGTGHEELRLGLRNWMQSLIDGKYVPTRLKRWYEINHSKAVSEARWKAVLSKIGAPPPERY